MAEESGSGRRDRRSPPDPDDPGHLDPARLSPGGSGRAVWGPRPKAAGLTSRRAR